MGANSTRVLVDRLVDAIREAEYKHQQAAKLMDKCDQLTQEVERLNRAVAQGKAPMDTSNFTAKNVAVLCNAFNGGRKIDAIKALRVMTGLGLVEAKNVIEGALAQ